MKDFDYYSKVDAEYPSLQEIKAKKLAVVAETRLTEKERLEAIKMAEAGAMNEWRDAKKVYDDARGRKDSESWADCRLDLCYDKFLDEDGCSTIESKAWDKGHSAGYSEVYNVLSDLAIMAKKLVKQPNALAIAIAGRDALLARKRWDSMPADRGGKAGPKGKAYNVFLTARDHALELAAGLPVAECG